MNRENQEYATVNHCGDIEVPIDDGRDGRTLLPRYREQHQPKISLKDSDSESDESLTARTQAVDLNREKTTEDILGELYSDPGYRLKVYFSHCCLRELRKLKMLCRRYSEDPFVASVDEDGNTGLLLAATEENGLETLRWLEKQGGSIHRANHYDRTPLMEAALWGRTETVQYLVQQGVQTGQRDANGMQAIDLAADTKRNAKERIQRAGGIYREVPDASRQRQLSHALLERLASTGTRPSATEMAPTRRAFFGRKPDGKLEVYRTESLLEPPGGPHGQQKAFATLNRGPDYPYINAMSGYSHPGWSNVLDNDVWTAKAEGMRRMFGLPKDKSAASHVEPQLLAYLVDRHSLYDPITSEEEEKLQELWSAMPVYNLNPVITVSKNDFCPRCSEFFQAFKANLPGFGATFHFVGDALADPLCVRN